jgi:hypothetical protein
LRCHATEIMAGQRYLVKPTELLARRSSIKPLAAASRASAPEADRSAQRALG